VSDRRRKIVVVGGGITGLTAAYTLQQEAQNKKLPLDVVLVESSLRIGGKIETLRHESFIIERGPESFFDSEQYIRKLARDLHIEDQLIQHNDGNTYVAVGGELHSIPTSVMLGGSSKVTGLVTSSLISLSGKLRAVGDLFIGKSAPSNDEPISEFFKRRFGSEIVENLVEPLLAGTFAGDIDHLSMQAMFPQFTQLELTDRSLIIGFLKNRQGFYNTEVESSTMHYETFKNGLSTLIETLQNQLMENTIRKGVKVTSVEKNSENVYEIYTQSGEVMTADGVIITTPFKAAQSMLKDIEAVQAIVPSNSATIGTVTMAFKKEDITRYKDAINIFISRNSHFAITSCTFANRKWDNVCDDDHELVRIYIGRVGDESIVELSDQEILTTVLNDLQTMIGIHVEPIFAKVTRWQKAMPQYTVGHSQRVEQLQQAIRTEFPNVLVAGSSYQGISMPNCVKQGRLAANELIGNLLQ
jgi:protoporphyrinogen/coproporphyrinogen III oxidase